MARDDEFVRLAAEYAANNGVTVNGVDKSFTELSRGAGVNGLRRAMFAAMGGADTKAATLADGTVVTATVRGSAPAVFEVSVVLPLTGVAVVEDSP